MRLLVVSPSPPESSLRCPLYIITLPHPPGPGFPLQAPSVYITMLLLDMHALLLSVKFAGYPWRGADCTMPERRSVNRNGAIFGPSLRRARSRITSAKGDPSPASPELMNKGRLMPSKPAPAKPCIHIFIRSSWVFTFSGAIPGKWRIRPWKRYRQPRRLRPSTIKTPSLSNTRTASDNSGSLPSLIT